MLIGAHGAPTAQRGKHADTPEALRRLTSMAMASARGTTWLSAEPGLPVPCGRNGYVNGKWRDIMSYQQSCDGCVRIPYWSNPRVVYKGEPTGTQLEDNARVILELFQVQVSASKR